jgi:hypothetical protein
MFFNSVLLYTDGINIKRSLSFLGKCIDIKGILSEHFNINKNLDSLKQWKDSGEIGKREAEKFRNYTPTPFIEKSIIKLWCDNKQINYVSEIHDKRPYFFLIF